MSDAANGSGVERYGTQRRHGEPLRVLALGALGVVFGDIGTSPLYALKTCMEAAKGVAGDPGTVLGILSLIFWAITLVVTVKYVGLRAAGRQPRRRRGPGAHALVLVVNEGKARYPVLLAALGLAGCALFYGDGTITPAISVLSAIEGLEARRRRNSARRSCHCRSSC